MLSHRYQFQVKPNAGMDYPVPPFPRQNIFQFMEQARKLEPSFLSPKIAENQNQRSDKGLISWTGLLLWLCFGFASLALAWRCWLWFQFNSIHLTWMEWNGIPWKNIWYRSISYIFLQQHGMWRIHICIPIPISFHDFAIAIFYYLWISEFQKKETCK